MKKVHSMIWARWVAFGLILAIVSTVFYYMVMDMNPRSRELKVADYRPWQAETVAAAESVAVMDGGRVKPLSTHAAFMLLRLRGERSIVIEGAEGKKIKIKPVEWMMDCLFRPRLAVELPTFRVDHGAAIEAIGLKAQERRDRYSYRQLESAREKLFTLAQSYESIDEKRRDAVQKQIVDLAYNVRTFESLIGYFGFARMGIEMKGAGEKGASRFTETSAVMATAPMIQKMIQESQTSGKDIPPNLKDLLQQVLDGANFAKFSLVLLPPLDATSKDWRSAGDRIMDVMTGKEAQAEEAMLDIRALETLIRVPVEQEAEFRSALVKLKQRLDSRAQPRGDLRAIAAEVNYNQRNFTLNAMVYYLLGMLLVAAMWGLHMFDLNRASRVLGWCATLCSVAGVSMLLVAIGMRVFIMWRPPVGNLYDTVLFIGVVMVLLLFLMEWVGKNRLAMTLVPVVGLALVLLARRFEVGDAKDHMDPLVAVLNSNYWLSTHVITVTMGYAAGLLTAALSVVYVLIRGLGLDAEASRVRRQLTTAAYGCLCLTLFLSLVGTVLGGIWANDSWGRFWGWDPKENGALMIVLWSLVILHARLGGLIREWGFHLASLVLACIVSFSWWHVNFLGVGLHNYGFTSGKMTIWLFYAVMALLMVFGVIMWICEQISTDQRKQSPVGGVSAKVLPQE